MIALAVHPPGQPRGLARIAQAQRSASVGSVSVHQGKSRWRRREHGTAACCCQAGRPLVRADDVIEYLPHIMTLLAQPFRETSPSAAVNEEPHPYGTFTASMRSLAITACA